MIRINLLPVKRRKKIQRVPPYIIHAAIILTVTILVLVFFTFYLSSKVSGLKDQVAVKEARLGELQEKLKDVENFEKDNESYRRKSEIIEKLRKNQDVPMKLLEETSARLPKGVWLTSLVDKGGVVNIQGFAFSNSNLVEYIQNLKGSKYLTDVELLESRQKTMGDVASLYEFKLTLRIKV